MIPYHKIENIFERNLITNKLIRGKYRSEAVEYLSSLEWIATEKVDGTNIRVMWDGEKVTFGGKTDNAQLHGDLIKRLYELFGDKKEIWLEKFGEKKVCLYGEGYGAGIQKGGVYGPTKDFILFDVLIDGIWLERGNVEGVADIFDINVVPIAIEGDLLEIVQIVEQGLESFWGDFICEGVVARPINELKDKRGNRIIVKVKTRDFD